jgi:hypothetical protein
MLDPLADPALREFALVVMAVIAGAYVFLRLLTAYYRFRRGGFK